MLDLIFGDSVLVFLSLGVVLLSVLVLILAVSVVLLRIRNLRTATRWRGLEEKWQPAVLAALDGSGKIADVWKLIEAGEEESFLEYLLRFNSRLKGDERLVVHDLARPYMDRAMPYTRHRDIGRRAQAVRLLAELGLPEHADTITAALDDPSPLVMMVAVRGLMRPEYSQFAGAVLARLHRFTSWSPKFLASLLASVGTDAAPTIRSTLTDPSVAGGVRAIAASALAELGDIESADAAADVLGTTDDVELSAACLRVLARTGRPEHAHLVRGYLDHPDFVLRASAAQALGTVGDVEDNARLLRAVEDESRWVAIHAARALRAAGDTSSLNQLAGSRHARASVALQVLTETAE